MIQCPKCKNEMREITLEEFKARFPDTKDIDLVLENVNVYICDECDEIFEVD